MAGGLSVGMLVDRAGSDSMDFFFSVSNSATVHDRGLNLYLLLDAEVFVLTTQLGVSSNSHLSLLNLS